MDTVKKMARIRVTTELVCTLATLIGIASIAHAQTGTVPLDAGTPPSGLTNSSITELDGNVGIGTTSPGAPLQVVGTGNVVAIGEASNSSGHQLILGANASNNGYGLIQSVYEGIAYTPLILNSYGGNVGIGTTTPQGQLSNNSINYGDMGAGTSGGSFNWVHTATDGGWNTISSAGGNGLVVATDQAGGTTFQVSSGIYNSTTGQRPNHLFTVLGEGNVGIGTTSPQYTLDVAGSVHASGPVYYQDGSQQTTAWTGVLCGGDYAEAVDASGDHKHYEPGDVLVLGSGADGDVEKSAEPYSTMVAGIFATKPGVVGRRETLSKSAQEIPMAMVGIVPTKVSTENGPIRRGDLLVSSSLPGYAMKGTDRSRLVGAVIGKAMGSLDSGKGTIEVLVTLQ